METYLITVWHGLGTSTIQTVAKDIISAINLVMMAENCPINAIIKVEKL